MPLHRRTLTTAALAVLLVTAGCAGAPLSGSADAQSSAQQSTTADDRTIHVAGSGSAEARPNQAKVGVAVVATADDAATARQRLAANVSRMRRALVETGVDETQITTRHYDIDRDRRRPRPDEEGGEREVQYRAWHAFEITVTETDRVGTVIDTAVRNGATEINRIEFTLSTERRRELEADARSAAMADARQKAQSLAADADLTVTGVKVIRTGGSDSPRPAGDTAAMATATPVAEASTDLESGPVTVVTRVRVVYNAAPAEGETTTEAVTASG
jgi:hypothetical protein